MTAWQRCHAWLTLHYGCVSACRRWDRSSTRCSLLLPARLRHAGDLAFESQPAEADTTHREQADIAPRPAAEAAAASLLHRIFGRPVALDDHRNLSHV